MTLPMLTKSIHFGRLYAETLSPRCVGVRTRVGNDSFACVGSGKFYLVSCKYLLRHWLVL